LEKYIWIKHIYWKLNELSCILVKRNKKWFQDVIPIMKDFWEIIQKEKISGFEHRKPKEKNKSNKVVSPIIIHEQS